MSLQSDYYRMMADRWEFFEDISVSADLMIDLRTSKTLHRQHPVEADMTFSASVETD